MTEEKKTKSKENYEDDDYFEEFEQENWDEKELVEEIDFKQWQENFDEDENNEQFEKLLKEEIAKYQAAHK